MPRAAFQRSPVDVERDTIVTDGLDLLQYVCPEVDRWQAPGMELSRIEKDSLAAYKE